MENQTEKKMEHEMETTIEINYCIMRVRAAEQKSGLSCGFGP